MSDSSSSPLSPWFAPAPAGAPPSKPLRAIGLVGIGKTGAGLAHWCATKGLGVIMYDEESGALTQAVGVIRGLFQTAEERNEITPAAAHKAMGGIGITTSIEDLEFCDAIIDTRTEDGGTKRARFAALGKLVSPETVLAANASAEGLEELAAATPEPGRVIGLGFFDPISTSPQVQVLIGSQTARIPAERVLAFLAVLGRKPVVHGKPRQAV